MKEGVKKRPSRLKVGRMFEVEGVTGEIVPEKLAMISATLGCLLTLLSTNMHSLEALGTAPILTN
jgi:hypothetical protein